MSVNFDEVVAIVAKHLKVEPGTIKPNAHLIQDLGADSLDMVEMVIEIEEKYNISIPESVSEKITTVQEIIEHLEKENIIS